MKLKAMVFVMLLAGCGSLPEPMVDSSVETMTDGGLEEDSSLILGDGSVEGAGDAEASTPFPIDSGVGGEDSGAESGTDAAVPDSGLHDSGVADSGIVDAGTPTRLEPVELAASGSNTCARDRGDSVWCWGSHYRGIEYVGSFTSIAGSCGVRSDGVVACFTPRTAPASISTAGGLLTASVVGDWSTFWRGCALNAGEVWCWEAGGPAIRLPGITGAIAATIDCAVSPAFTWCWDLPLAVAIPARLYTGGVRVSRGSPTGSGLCVDRGSSLGVICDGGNRDCAIRSGPEQSPGVFRPTSMGLAPYVIGSGYCQVLGGNSVACWGPGPAFGGSSPCTLRSIYGGPGAPIEVVQLVAGTEVCALLRLTLGPLTIECWGSGPPAPIAW